MKINTKVIKKLNPCEDRFNNWLKHYDTKTYNLRSFLGLKHITHKDKLWVVLRLIDNDTKVFFALDCSFAAYAAAYAADAAAAYAADAAAYAADAAAAYAAADAAYATFYSADAAFYSADAAFYSADAASYAAAYAAANAATYARKKEENRQIEALIYLIEGK
jgi:hypothetical protein